MSSVKRDRHQLVIHLGEGVRGLRLRKEMAREAKRAGMMISVWAREVLMTALGETDLESHPLDSSRISVLERKVREIQERLFLVEHPPPPKVRDGHCDACSNALSGRPQDICTCACAQCVEQSVHDKRVRAKTSSVYMRSDPIRHPHQGQYFDQDLGGFVTWNGTVWELVKKECGKE